MLLDLQGYMLLQHNHTFTYSCKHGNHVRRSRNNAKRHSFWRQPALLLCVYEQFSSIKTANISMTEVSRYPFHSEK